MILVVAGPSGVGKSRLVNYAVDGLGYVRTVPYTTRPKRADESEGVDYHYLDKQTFRSLIAGDWFVDWDYTVGNYYGYGPELRQVASEGLDTAIPVVARMAVRLRRLLPDLLLLFVDGDRGLLEDRIQMRRPSEVERILRQEHANEEREHAPLFDCRWNPDPSFGLEEVAALLAEITLGTL